MPPEPADPAASMPTEQRQLRPGFLSPEDATKRAKDDFGTDVRFESAVSEREFKFRVERKQAEEARELIFQTAPSGITAGTVGFLTQLGVSALDPVNVGSAFIPFVREARLAAWSARAGSTVARGLRGGVI